MRRLVALLTIVVGLAVTSGTASAGGGLLSGLLGGGCGVTAPVFLPWGDYSGYYFAPNGGFESGSTSWTLSGGAAVVTQDNEPWYLAGFGSHALSIPTGRQRLDLGLLRRSRIPPCGSSRPATAATRRCTSASSRAACSASSPSSTAARSRRARPGARRPSFRRCSARSAAPLGSKTMTLQFTVERGTAQIDDLFVDPFLMKG